MTSAIDCVASYIASAFSFCSLVYIIPSFPPVQDYVRRPKNISAKMKSSAGKSGEGAAKPRLFAL